MHHRIRRAVGTLLTAGLLGSGLVALDVPVAQAAYAVPPTRSDLTTSIESLQPYVGQSTCDPVAKPGVSAFRNMLLRTYPDSGSFGIVRDCGSGGQSEHKEGRAFDWKMSVYNSRQRAEVSALLNWLLKTDQYGNANAMARRTGLMYMIWNRKIWKAYDAGAGWQAYSGPSAHTDHVHFSFGWNGAKKVSSYWDGSVAKVDFGPDAPPRITPVRSIANIALVRQHGSTTLGLHDGGDAVRLVQKTLRVSPVDGDFGSGTATYVMKFQQDQGLPLTGQFGPTEWRRLFPFPIAPFGRLDPAGYVLGTAVVRGWAIDADTLDPIKVSAYVDGVAAETITAAEPRNDVYRDFPEYGAQHGFTFALPVSDGTHQICVVARNATDTPGLHTSLGCQSVSAQHSPMGAVNTLTSSLGKVTLTGWALDPDAADVLPTTLTVDGEPSSVVPTTVTRTDIAVRFPGVGDQHGVRAVLELAEGTRTVCLQAPNVVDAAGNDATVGCKTVVVEHTPVGALSTLRRAPNGVLVSGWALDPDVVDATTVELRSDGVPVTTLSATRTRTELATSYPANGTAHGFTTLLDLPVGQHTVCAIAVNATGTPGSDKTLACGPVVVSHNGAGVLSALRTVPGGAVRVTGDAYDPDSLDATRVTVKVNGAVFTTLSASRTSTTSAARWPGYGSARGFAGSLTLPRGRHTICVLANNVMFTPGVDASLGCKIVTVHDAVGGVTSWSRSYRTVTFRGWAIDPDTTRATRAALVIDKRVVSYLTAARYRSYLGTSVMPGYGHNHGVTFVRTLSRGQHTVCLIALNVSGTPGVARYGGCRTITVP